MVASVHIQGEGDLVRRPGDTEDGTAACDNAQAELGPLSFSCSLG